MKLSISCGGARTKPTIGGRAGCKAPCRREAPDNLMVPDKIVKEKHDEHVSANCEGSDDGSHRGPAYRASRRGGARRTILGAEDEPRPILETVNGQPRPIFRANNNDPGLKLGTDNDHPGPIFWIDQDESRPAWAMAREKLDETVRHHAGAEAIPSRCDGPGRPRFQNAPFDLAGQHE
jgi:hypothetical protein